MARGVCWVHTRSVVLLCRWVESLAHLKCTSKDVVTGERKTRSFVTNQKGSRQVRETYNTTQYNMIRCKTIQDHTRQCYTRLLGTTRQRTFKRTNTPTTDLEPIGAFTDKSFSHLRCVTIPLMHTHFSRVVSKAKSPPQCFGSCRVKVGGCDERRVHIFIHIVVKW